VRAQARRGRPGGSSAGGHPRTPPRWPDRVHGRVFVAPTSVRGGERAPRPRPQHRRDAGGGRRGGAGLGTAPCQRRDARLLPRGGVHDAGTVNAAALVIILLNRGPEFGFSLDDPGPLPVIAHVIARLVAAVLLLVGGLAALRQTSLGHRPAVVLVLAPSVLTLTLLGLIAYGASRSRSPFSRRGSTTCSACPGEPLELSMLSAGLSGSSSASAPCSRRRRGSRTTRRSGATPGRCLPVHRSRAGGLQPGARGGESRRLRGDGDERRRPARRLLRRAAGRRAGADPDRRARHRRGERPASPAARRGCPPRLLEERGRLAREVHDGLAQDLWTARLKQGRLAGLLEEGEAKELAST
jgi:signal transduction histidine kinase